MSSTGNVGSFVALSSSNDDRHPPECISDRNPDTYWATTGLFPQEVVITLPSLTNLTGVTIKSTNVRKLSLERSKENGPTEFHPITDKELESKEGHLQVEEFRLKSPVETKHLKLILQEGYGHFAFVYSSFPIDQLQNHENLCGHKKVPFLVCTEVCAHVL
ncbi:intraflagellar transport protein 25 homolog [Halichondria panicea]|uniref:intraflagellar transport protein 25 homolog n=1 Tax=Halichondria panicea TaxID=6063 RepID=UPI00312B3045